MAVQLTLALSPTSSPPATPSFLLRQSRFSGCFVGVHADVRGVCDAVVRGVVVCVHTSYVKQKKTRKTVKFHVEAREQYSMPADEYDAVDPSTYSPRPAPDGASATGAVTKEGYYWDAAEPLSKPLTPVGSDPGSVAYDPSDGITEHVVQCAIKGWDADPAVTPGWTDAPTLIWVMWALGRSTVCKKTKTIALRTMSRMATWDDHDVRSLYFNTRR